MTATQPAAVATQRTGADAPSGSRRRRSMRGFLRPYRGSLSLASGLILVETLLDLARPWPLKLAVDNAIGGGRWVGRWACWTSWGRRGGRRWPRWRESGWSGSGRSLAIWSPT
jgi:hypothetical protein